MKNNACRNAIALTHRDDGKSAYNWIFKGCVNIFRILIENDQVSRQAVLSILSNVEKIEHRRL